MNKRIVIILGVVITVTLLTVLALIAFGGKSQPSAPQLIASPSAEPLHEDQNPENLTQINDEVSKNPLLTGLPHDTPYWSVEWAGQENGRYVVKATIHHVDQAGRDAAIAKQRPYIEAYLRSTGQPDGSYVVRYEAVPDSDDL
jgi:hypothetical protein